MKSFIGTVALSSVALFFVACAPSSNFQNKSQIESQDIAAKGILDGVIQQTRPTTAAKSVVYLGILGKHGQEIAFCSGTLIGPHTVLTAAHCFDNDLLPGVTSFNVVFENKVFDFGPKLYRNGLGYSVHPKYNTESKKPRLYDHDIAVVAFLGDIPPGFNTVNIDSDVTANYSAADVYVYGYGRYVDYKGDDTDSIRKSGTLRRGIMKIDADYNKSLDRYFISPLSPTFVCQGDSGGPQFHHENGVLKLIGVNSASFGTVLANGRQSCHGYSQATKVAPAYSWIMSEQKKLLDHHQ